MDLKQVFEECQKIDQRFKSIRRSLPYTENDNRKHFFGVLRSQMIHYEIMLHIMWARYNRSLEPESVFKDVIGIGYGEQGYWEEFQVTAKMSYLTLSHFVIENFLKTLLAEVDITQNPPSGFYKLSKTLLEKISVSNKDRKLEILNALAMTRNSMHSNGIHVPIPPAPNSQTITIGGTVFQFDKGQPTSITESNMIDLINGVIDVLEEIVHSQEVRQIPAVPLLYVPKH